jgi:tetratricopeptide (TPR) repeat protein
MAYVAASGRGRYQEDPMKRMSMSTFDKRAVAMLLTLPLAIASVLTASGCATRSGNTTERVADGTAEQRAIEPAPAPAGSAATDAADVVPPAAAENAPADVATPASPRDKEILAALMAAEFAWQDGRGESAAKHYARAAELSDDPKVAEQAARVAIVAKQWEIAPQVMARWRTLDPDSAGLRQADAAMALGRGETDRAVKMIAAMLAAETPEERRLGAQALLAAGENPAAGVVLEKLIDVPEANRDVDTLVLLSQIAQQQKKTELAARLAQRAIERFPDSATAHVWRGHLALRANDRVAARRELERAVALAPTDREVRLTYAALLNDSGDSAAAARALADLKPDDDVLGARAAYAARANDKRLMADAYETLTQLPEPHPDARLELLGQMAELTENKDEALAWYREVARGEHYADAQMRIAVLLDDAGKHDEAREQLRALRAEGIEADAKLADTFLLEAELLGRRDKEDEAVTVYAAGLKALPDERRLLYGRALLQERRDHLPEAEADLRRIVELNPDDPDALNALGYTLADRTDRYDEARGFIEKALKQKPDEPAIVDSMGWVLYKQKQYDESIRHLRRAYELQPDAEIAAHLGEVLWAAGQREEARKVWQQGKDKDPDNETLRDTIARLTK